MLLLVLLICHIVGYAASYSGSVGETIYLPTPNVSVGYIDKAVWACSSPCISFVSKSESGAEIKIVKAFTGTVQVELVYVQTWVTTDGKRQQNTYSTYYNITCTGGGSSSQNATSISIPEHTKLKMGETTTIEVKVTPEGSNPGTLSYSWNPYGIMSASMPTNTSVKIFTLSPGTTTLTLTNEDGLSASGTIEVIEPDIMETVAPTTILLPTQLTLHLGQTFNIKPIILPSNSITSLRFDRHGKAITVSNDGKIEAVQPGSSNIEVYSYNDKRGYGCVNVVESGLNEDLRETYTNNTLVRGFAITVLKRQ